MKKRILAFLLAVSIAVSALVLPVSAASIRTPATANSRNRMTASTTGEQTRSVTM